MANYWHMDQLENEIFGADGFLNLGLYGKPELNLVELIDNERDLLGVILPVMPEGFIDVHPSTLLTYTPDKGKVTLSRDINNKRSAGRKRGLDRMVREVKSALFAMNGPTVLRGLIPHFQPYMEDIDYLFQCLDYALDIKPKAGRIELPDRRLKIHTYDRLTRTFQFNFNMGLNREQTTRFFVHYLSYKYINFDIRTTDDFCKVEIAIAIPADDLREWFESDLFRLMLSTLMQEKLMEG